MDLQGRDGLGSVDGHVDGWDGARLRGWAWVPEMPQAILRIDVIARDGTIVATTTADIFRGDLAIAGKRRGSCSFFVEVPRPADPLQLRVIAHTGDISADLDGSPCDYPSDGGQTATAFDNRLSDDTSLSGYLDETGRFYFRGWVHDGSFHGPAVELELVEGDRCIARGSANIWREDVVDLRQGNGRVGFHIPFPSELYDGKPHYLTLRRGDGGRILLKAPVEILLDKPAPAIESKPAIVRPAADAPIMLSIVVNFYNMRREAERTLHSLSRAFQRDIEGLAYEVLCIDNGSTDALDAAFVEKFGPEFRLVHPTSVRSSPVFALNEAAAIARGRWLALMIDGAHLLSPGALAEAMAALRSQKGAVVGLRQWFVGGDQRWLSTIGYSGAREDILFSRIDWPECGYDIFEISSPILESSNHWFDGMSETNCLFLSADAFRAIGGFDEAFSEAGGGFANLDLFVRAARAEDAVLIALVGEASFHQYHGGTTTNVSDAQKDVRVRDYSKAFETVRGTPFLHLDTDEIRLCGQIRTKEALTGRRPPNDRTKLGLTGHVRPAGLASSFDRGMQSLARAAYVEAGLHERTLWAGLGTGVAPADLIEIQQIFWSSRPDAIICKDIPIGLLGYIASLLPSLGLKATTIIWVTIDAAGQAPDGVLRIVGDPASADVLERIDEALAATETVMAIVRPREEEALPVDIIRTYAHLVSAGDYLVVLDGAFGQPDLGYSQRWIEKAIERFMRAEPHFQRDHMFNAHLVSTCPSGFLRRIPNVHSDLSYDPALDVLEDFDRP